jgi:hypothetical protein
VIGPPFSVDDLRALPNTKETWQKIADRLMEKIAELARPAAGTWPNRPPRDFRRGEFPQKEV